MTDYHIKGDTMNIGECWLAIIAIVAVLIFTTIIWVKKNKKIRSLEHQLGTFASRLEALEKRSKPEVAIKIQRIDDRYCCIFDNKSFLPLSDIHVQIQITKKYRLGECVIKLPIPPIDRHSQSFAIIDSCHNKKIRGSAKGKGGVNEGCAISAIFRDPRFKWTREANGCTRMTDEIE